MPWVEEVVVVRGLCRCEGIVEEWGGVEEGGVVEESRIYFVVKDLDLTENG